MWLKARSSTVRKEQQRQQHYEKVSHRFTWWCDVGEWQSTVAEAPTKLVSAQSHSRLVTACCGSTSVSVSAFVLPLTISITLLYVGATITRDDTFHSC